MKPSSNTDNQDTIGSNVGSYQTTPSSYNNYHSIIMNDSPSHDDGNERQHAASDPVIPLAPPPNATLQSPPYQHVERTVAAGTVEDPLAPMISPREQNEGVSEVCEDDNKTCRICLEDDSPETMIAPCKCKGFSKFVHRDCLDEWRLQESDRAFSKCTECLFDYYMQPIYKDEDGTFHRRIKFYWNVSRDVCFGTLLMQLLIVAFGALIYVCDPNKALPNQIMPAFQSHPYSLYYLLGWLLLLILFGVYGSGVLCINGCNISKSIPQFYPPSASTKPPTMPTKANPTISRGNGRIHPFTASGATTEDQLARRVGMESTTDFYRRARHRRRRNYHHDQTYHRHYNNDDVCCDSCVYCCNRQPILIYHPYGGYYDCCCCDDYGYRHNHSNQDTECCSCCDGQHCGGDGGNQDCGEFVHVLLIILLVFAIILAVIGFFVGIVVTTIAFQRIVQRHIHILQKKQLVQEYQVMDLQEYDLDQPLPTAPRQDDLEWNGATSWYTGTTPTAPLEPLPVKDVTYLQKLGLKE